MRLSIIGVVVLSFVSTYAADGPVHEPSSMAATGRYEIVQSTTTIKNTFRLDKFAGKIWILAK